jgi:integron integrase
MLRVPDETVQQFDSAMDADNINTGLSWERELQELKNTIRLRNYSPRTLETYRLWTRKFQTFTRSKPPSELSTADVKAFLTDLAVEQNVAASTQNQAFNALLFFFRHVLGKEFGKVDGVVRAKRRRYIPVVLSRTEVDRVVAQLAYPYNLVVLLLYGCGLRLSEALDLRIQCFNLDEGVLTIHDGKGQKDRTVPLPRMLLPRIKTQFERVDDLRRNDQKQGTAGVFLPRNLEKKYPNAGREFVWQWFFPAKQLTFVKKTEEYRRYHVLGSEVQKAVKVAANDAGIPKRVTPHTFRHTFASHLLQANVDIRTIQERLGHSDVRTTMIYTHTVPSRTCKDAGSPLDMST